MHRTHIWTGLGDLGGTKIKNTGQKRVLILTNEKQLRCVTVQIAKVKKTLASVSKSNKQSKGGQIDKVPQHVLFVDGLHLTARSFVQRYASRGQPIVLQNLKEYMLGERSSDAASSSRTSSSLFFWSKTNMIKKYGSYLISVTNRTLVLPLQSFGRNEGTKVKRKRKFFTNNNLCHHSPPLERPKKTTTSRNYFVILIL